MTTEPHANNNASAEMRRPTTANENPSKRPRQSVGSSTTQVNQALAHARSKVSLLVHNCQMNNPMLRYIRHVRKEFNDSLVPDFVCGPTTCVLYLSLQYHKLHPRYIYARIRQLPPFRLRILLVLADVPDHRSCLQELTKLTLINNMTLICAGCDREAARYLETFRSYDTKGAEGIQERVGGDYASRLNAAMSSIRGINRTDVATLAFTFGSVKDIACASREQLRQCPGIGERKVDRLFTALHQPFRTDIAWSGVDQNSIEEDDAS